MWLGLLTSLVALDAVPSGEIAQIFLPEDYPLEALKLNETGTVAIEADVRPDGRVSDCRITKSSGSSRLDRATCTVITKRGRFNDRAKAHDGKSFTITTQVSWDVQPSGIPLTVSELRIVYTPGDTLSCRTESPQWMSMEDACERSRANAKVAIGQLSKSRSLAGLDYVIEMASIPGDHLADNRIGEGRGEQLLGRQTAVLSLAKDGKVITCQGGEDSLAGDLSAWCASMTSNEQYEAVTAADGNVGMRQLTKVNAIYLRPRSQ